MELVAKRIPKEMFEKVYKIQLPDTFTATQLLQIYSGYKGYVTGSALPDESKAARIMLKDYNNGKILFVHLRPDYDKEKHGKVTQSNVEYTLKVDENEPLEESKGEITVEDSVTEQSEISEPSSLMSNKTEPKMPQTLRNHKEEQFDKQFFETKTEKKLNKAQKRAIKFAVKRGEDPESVDLDNPYLQKKGKREIAGYGAAKTKTGVNSNKLMHFSNMVIE